MPCRQESWQVSRLSIRDSSQKGKGKQQQNDVKKENAPEDAVELGDVHEAVAQGAGHAAVDVPDHVLGALHARAHDVDRGACGDLVGWFDRLEYGSCLAYAWRMGTASIAW
jgi:hypothetical protein